MKLADAKKLHNEDEVIDKKTGESISVLSIKTMPMLKASPKVEIEGVGSKTGYSHWYHEDVK